MAPPPLPPDYGASNMQSANTAQNEIMDMGWAAPSAQQTTANKDDDWGNTDWGFSGGNTAANKPIENNFQQAGGNPHTSSSSGFNNDFTSSKPSSNSAANTNQVTLIQGLCCFCC